MEVELEKLPEAALHVPTAAEPPITPARVTVPPAHMVWSIPAFIVAIGFTVIRTWSLTNGQGPEGSSVVNVRVIVPLVIVGV